MIKLKQALLKSEDKKLIAWLRVKPLLKEGLKITLKDRPEIWTISILYNTELELEQIHTDWHVGGL